MSMKVLIADDDIDIRLLLERLFTVWGYEPVLVSDGNEAMEVIEATGKILVYDPDAVVIASSGYLHDPVISDYKRFGFSGVLPKPYRATELSLVLFKALAKGPGEQTQPSY